MEDIIKKRPLSFTEDLVAGRIPLRPSRRRPSPAKAPETGQMGVEQPSRISRLSRSSSSMNVDPVTPPPKHRYRSSACAHDLRRPLRPTEFICYSPAIRRHSKKTRSINSRRLWTPPSPTKSPSVVSPRERPPLGPWTPLSVSASNFYTPESSHDPITPVSNTASVLIAPWTISSTSSLYFPHSN